MPTYAMIAHDGAPRGSGALHGRPPPAPPPIAGEQGTSLAMGREGTTAHTSGPEVLRRAHIPDHHWGSVREGHHMTENGSILVTGAAGQLGAVGRTVTGLLLERGLPVRAMVRREDDRAAA